ncbi:MAG: hypothetical protein ACFNYB_03860 [Campylobacter sp.]
MSKNMDQNLDERAGERNSGENRAENLGENAGVNLDAGTDVNLNENGEKNAGESEQARENLNPNSGEANGGAENISRVAPKCRMQNLFKKALEILLQGAASALVYAGRAGLWLLDAASGLKDETQKAQLSKINEERAKFDGASIISQDKVKEIVANRLKTDADGIEFGRIYLAKRCALGSPGGEYFYETKAKFNGF